MSTTTTGREAPGLAPGLLRVGAVVAVAYLAHALVPGLPLLALSVALGVATAAAGWWPASSQPGVRFAARRLLRGGIVLLGFSLSAAQVLALGAAGVAAVVGVVVVTFAATLALARLLGVGRDLALLVAAGYSICGASAIAAVEPATDAEREEVAYAIALVTLCGTSSILVLPLLASALGLAEATAGAWVGAAVHDVGQVVATSSVVGALALQTAVVVKLTRVLMLGPLVIGLTLVHRRRTGARGGAAAPPLLPLFVAGFVVAVAVRSTGVLPAGALEVIGIVEELLLAAALVALGSGVRWQQLRRLGGRPLALGLVAWVVVAGVALAAVLLGGL